MSVLRINQINYQIAGKTLFKECSLNLSLPSKTAIIGKNGVGKTALLKLIFGDEDPDQGEIIWPNHILVKMLSQNPQFKKGSTILSTLKSGISASHDTWELDQEIETILKNFELDGEALIENLSEGQRRKVALAQIMVTKPDAILMDEPTNHLDMESIEWLTQWCKRFRGTLIIISHDRYFLDEVVDQIIEVYDGQLLSWPGNYAKHLIKKEAFYAEIESNQAKLDTRLKAEKRWLERGVTARRKRNMGRLRAMEILKKQRQDMVLRRDRMELRPDQSIHASKKLITCQNLSFSYDQPIINPFSLTIFKGDHIGIVGPNGIGKTTLIKLLIGSLTPGAGTIKNSESLKVAYFDQRRENLNENQSLIDFVGEGSTHVGSKNQHVVSYLESFLFTPDRMNVSMRQFSGGEKQRALLAKLLSQPANLFILDEPTNDLDIDTIESLEQYLIETEAAVLFISHDRQFIDHLANRTLFFKGSGNIEEFAGGVSDAFLQGATWPKNAQDNSTKKKGKSNHKHLKKIERQIENEETKLHKLEKSLEDPKIFSNHQKVKEIQLEIREKRAFINNLYEEWSLLEHK